MRVTLPKMNIAASMAPARPSKSTRSDATAAHIKLGPDSGKQVDTQATPDAKAGTRNRRGLQLQDAWCRAHHSQLTQWSSTGMSSACLVRSLWAQVRQTKYMPSRRQ